MKALLLLIGLSFSTPFLTGTPITDTERKHALEQLELSRQSLLTELEGLSPAQLNFKPAADKWSIAEITEHIGLAEMGIGQIVQQTLATPADSLRRKEIKVTDEKIRKILTNRRGKAQSPEMIKPTGRFTNMEMAINFFSNARKNNMALVQSTQEDLRNRYWQHPATGVIDLYQTILLMSAHCERHIAQIKEIKAASDFPAK